MRVRHDQFKGMDAYRSLPTGEFTISYNDNTHLEAHDWIPLLGVRVHHAMPPSIGEGSEKYYTIRCCIPVSKSITTDLRRVILDALSLSVCRSGLIDPVVNINTYIEIERLSRRDGTILVPDTNSLYNGSLHWLLRTLRLSHVWILPFVVSLTQLQQRDGQLKSLVNTKAKKNLRQALRSRGLVNGTMGLLERYRDQYQVLELDPSLLRYMRSGGRGGMDPDESDVLEDRLLVEGVHAIFKSTRTRAAQRVVTSDVFLARVLHSEGIPTLFTSARLLGDEEVPCIHYDPIARGFSGAPLSALLWDLAHTFSSIRLSASDRICIELGAYWADKTAVDWQEEVLVVDVPGFAAPSQPDVNGTSPERAATPQSALRAPPDVLSEAAVPRASLQQLLRLGGAVMRGPGSLTELLGRIPERERPIPGTAKRGLEILRRAGFLAFDGTSVSGTEKLRQLESAMRNENLDDVSTMLESFEPYGLVLSALKERGQLVRNEVELVLRSSISGALAREASEGLLRYVILLGQGWTDDRVVRDGSNRPTSEDALRGLYVAFKQTVHDGLARVVDLLPALCRDLHVSPWFAKRQIADLVADGQLRELSFQPAAGQKPIVRDYTVAGTLEHPGLTPVPIDRLSIGGRPVFTIGGDLP